MMALVPSAIALATSSGSNVAMLTLLNVRLYYKEKISGYYRDDLARNEMLFVDINIK